MKPTTQSLREYLCNNTVFSNLLVRSSAQKNRSRAHILQLLVFCIFFIMSTFTFAQSKYQDVVYLKNGSILRGVIIELIPEETVTIEIIGNNVFVFRMEEVEKIVKELPPKNKVEVDPSFRKRGYFGSSFGVSMPIGEFSEGSNGLANTGVQVNLINFGYRFTNNLGIAATWYGASNPIDAKNIDPWSYGGILIGPLLTYPISKRIEWDFRPMVGYTVTMLPDLGKGEEQATSFAMNYGTIFRINVSDKLALLVTADYLTTRPKFKDYKIVQQIGTISTGLGVAYRLR